VNTFAYNEIPWYASADVYYITEKSEDVSLKYILALLNSKLYLLWFYFRGKRKGESLELYGTPLSEVPINIIPEIQQKPFIDLVDDILRLTYSEEYSQDIGKQEQVRKLELEIDQMVYELYELSDEETMAVETFRREF
jgi:adenine-specific DNA-methyltransferase